MRTILLAAAALWMAGCARPAQIINLQDEEFRCSSAPGRWTLQPGNVLRGRVTNRDGEGQALVFVEIWQVGWGEISGPRETRTAPDGTFEIDNVVPGRYGSRIHRIGLNNWSGTVRIVRGNRPGPQITMCTQVLI